MTDLEARMVEMYEDRASMSEIARTLGVHPEAVRYVLTREGLRIRAYGTAWRPEELREWIRDRSEELGRSVRQVDLHKDPDAPSPQSITRHLGRPGETATQIIARVLDRPIPPGATRPRNQVGGTR